MLVICDQEPVSIVDVVFEPSAERASRKAIERISGAHALIVIDDLRNGNGALCD